MSEFIDALMKTEPEVFKEEGSVKEPNSPNTMSLQDMKDYFDAMKESMMSEFKKEIDAIRAKEETVAEPNNEATEQQEQNKEG